MKLNLPPGCQCVPPGCRCVPPGVHEPKIDLVVSAKYAFSAHLPKPTKGKHSIRCQKNSKVEKPGRKCNARGGWACIFCRSTYILPNDLKIYLAQVVYLAAQKVI